MKRVIAIVGVVLSVAIVVGAFIVGGGDDASEAKSPNPTVTADAQKDAVKAITNAGIRVQSEGPKKDTDSDDESGDDKNENEGKYETKKVFVSVSPNTVRIGKEFKIQVRGFTPKSTVVVTIAREGYAPSVYEIVVDKQGRGKTKDIKAPTTEGEYSVVALGPGSPGKVASTTLTVVKKK